MDAVFEYVKNGEEPFEHRRTWVSVSSDNPEELLSSHLRKSGVDPKFERIFIDPNNDAIDERIFDKNQR